MTKLRRDTLSSTESEQNYRTLRIIATGTLFVTHQLSVPSYPAKGSTTRAHAVSHTRGGSASNVLSLLAQFPRVDAMLLAALSGSEEGKKIIYDLEVEGVSTRLCKVWPSSGVPCAYVLDSKEDGMKTVINHNPLPDITHEEFISILGPLLAPENYPATSPLVAPAPIPHSVSSPSLAPRPSLSAPQLPSSPAPFDWIHFEGRSVKTTLSNITGLDSLARERKWRSHCTFSLDVGRRAKQGVEALIPHADIIFLSRQYAQSLSPQFSSSPRAFLLSLSSLVPPHALLIVHWGSEGAALLSLPTQEYYQSSAWVEEPLPQQHPNETLAPQYQRDDVYSIRSGSDFWAGRNTPSSSFWSAAEMTYSSGDNTGRESSYAYAESNPDYSYQSQPRQSDSVWDEGVAQDAFIAAMIYALGQRLAPGTVYTPSTQPRDDKTERLDDRGRWRLDECLRFATEAAGRRARRKNWRGLADEMRVF